MAFQVKNEHGTTVVVIDDPRLATAVRAVGYMWEDVKGQSAAETVLLEMIAALEQFSERFPVVLPHDGEQRADLARSLNR